MIGMLSTQKGRCTRMDKPELALELLKLTPLKYTDVKAEGKEDIDLKRAKLTAEAYNVILKAISPNAKTG